MNLESVFLAYIDKVQSDFSPAKDSVKRLSNLRLIKPSEAVLQASVASVEQSEQFRNLVTETRAAFAKDDFERTLGGMWEEYIQNFFRRSGCYQDIFAGRSADAKTLISLYQESFLKRQVIKTHLAPLEFVAFEKESLDLGGFQIIRYSQEQLERVLNQGVRKVFYPTIDTLTLSDYWFLQVQESVPNSRLDDIEVGTGPRVEMKYSVFPPPVESALRRLVLYDWRESYQQQQAHDAVDPWEAPTRFYIPFVIEVSDSLIQSPQGAPDTSLLAMQPVFHPDTDEEIDKEPARGLFLNHKETQSFQDCVLTADRMLANINDYLQAWKFFETGLRFLVKAYFTGGLEQLLWHITAIEAMLGQKIDGGLTKLLLSRVSLILSNTEQERKDIRKTFEKLYDFRSELIHGNPRIEDRSIYLGHLSKARDIARRIALWMLHYLYHVRQTLRGSRARIPTKDDLLAVLDMDVNTRASTAGILATLPASFPNVPDWTDLHYPI